MLCSTRGAKCIPFHDCARALAPVLIFLLVLMNACGGGSASSGSSSSGNTQPPPSGHITIDFSGRVGGVAIPAGLFGAQLGNPSSISDMQTLVSNGISGTRLY